MIKQSHKATALDQAKHKPIITSCGVTSVSDVYGRIM